MKITNMGKNRSYFCTVPICYGLTAGHRSNLTVHIHRPFKAVCLPSWIPGWKLTSDCTIASIIPEPITSSGSDRDGFRNHDSSRRSELEPRVLFRRELFKSVHLVRSALPVGPVELDGIWICANVIHHWGAMQYPIVDRQISIYDHRSIQPHKLKSQILKSNRRLVDYNDITSHDYLYLNFVKS